MVWQCNALPAHLHIVCRCSIERHCCSVFAQIFHALSMCLTFRAKNRQCVCDIYRLNDFQNTLITMRLNYYWNRIWGAERKWSGIALRDVHSVHGIWLNHCPHPARNGIHPMWISSTELQNRRKKTAHIKGELKRPNWSHLLHKISLRFIYWKITQFWNFSLFSTSSNAELYDYLRAEVGERMVDRMFDLTKEFKTIAEIGCNRGFITRHELPEGIEQFYLCDSSEIALQQAKAAAKPEGYKITTMHIDEEAPKVSPFLHIKCPLTKRN